MRLSLIAPLLLTMINVATVKGYLGRVIGASFKGDDLTCFWFDNYYMECHGDHIADGETYSLPSGYTTNDVVGVAFRDNDRRHSSDDRTIFWFRDGRASAGPYPRREWISFPYTLARGYTPNDVVGTAWSAKYNIYCAWYRDNQASCGRANDLDRNDVGHGRRSFTYSLAPGYTPDDVVAFAWSDYCEHVCAFYRDGKRSCGSKRDLDKVIGAKKFDPASHICRPPKFYEEQDWECGGDCGNNEQNNSCENPRNPSDPGPSEDETGWTGRAQHIVDKIQECFQGLFTFQGECPDCVHDCPGRSDHCRGNGIDVYPGVWNKCHEEDSPEKENGDDLVDWLVENHRVLKVKYVIWHGRQWYPPGAYYAGWRDYHPATCREYYQGETRGHYNHIHVSVN